MVEKGPKNESRKDEKGESILTKEFVEKILEMAKENLQKDGYLLPLLFIHFESGRRMVIGLELPDTTEQREMYFGAIGHSIKKTAEKIREAVFLSAVWYVESENPNLNIAPSQPPTHPTKAIIKVR